MSRRSGVLLLVGFAAVLGYWAGTTSEPGIARAGEKVAAERPASSPVMIPEPEFQSPALKGLRRSNDLRKMITTMPAVKSFTMAWAANPDGLYQNKFLGVPTIQNPLDVWVTQEILYEIKPDYLVETGSLEGGSAALWSTLLEQINPDAKIISIDIEDKVTAAKELPIVKRRVEFLIGDSVSPKIVADVKRRVAGGKVMVILDSAHTEEHVYRELQAYSPLVSVGSYVIVQDTGIAIPRYQRWPGRPDSPHGADRAVRKFMQDNEKFETDYWRERLILTHNPTGYLKRVR